MENPFVPTPISFTCDTFTPHVGEIFSIPVMDEEPIGLELISAEPVQLKSYDGRAVGKSGYVRTDPFSLVFRGPQEKMLSQGTYAFNHDTMETFMMTIVPIGPGEMGWLYQASFN